jgi:hypothetical protein
MKTKTKLSSTISGLAAMAMWCGASLNAAVIQVNNADITGTVQWYRTNTYVLNNFVYVEANEVLRIESGTVIKGKQGVGANASALFVTRGGKIFAEGTPDNPIVFTSELDSTVGEQANAGQANFGLLGSQLWGGVVVLGNATINSAKDNTGNSSTPKHDVFEGLQDTTGTGGQFLHRFGGPDDDDSSGVLRFVQIRYPGTTFFEDSELNGLTLGGVGRGTVLEYVEVLGSSDDGFEWWGGTVNSKYLVAAYCQDDSFDVDQGYRGKNQFWFVLQGNIAADHGGEIDGDLEPNNNNAPLGQWELYNATFVGNTAEEVFQFSDQARPGIWNSVFSGFGEGIEFRLDNEGAFDAGDVRLANNIWPNVGAALVISAEAGPAPVRDKVFANLFADSTKTNLTSDPLLRGTGLAGALDPRPAAGSPALNPANAKVAMDSFYTPTPYLGAFSENDLWISRWTALSQLGALTGNGKGGIVQVSNADITGTVNWYRTNTYVLNSFIYVETNEVLNIEAGTVIKGKQGVGANASALFVTQGGRIHANGTANNPIIFTSELDGTVGAQVNVAQANLGVLGSQLWGGVVLLGNAGINSAKDNTGNTSTPKYDVFEGLQDSTGTGGQFLHRFGGSDDRDNSGTLRYVQIRYPGTTFFEDSELNGLTMGGVGDGTTIEFVEVLGSSDDGFEWWGGTVNSRFLIAAYCQDDSFDVDQGYRGKNQFWFVLQGNIAADHGGEIDGDLEPNNNNAPLGQWELYNATFIGSTAEEVFQFSDQARPGIWNSVFSGFGEGIEFRLDNESAFDAGDVRLANNIWPNVGAALVISAEAGPAPVRDKVFANLFADSTKTNLTSDPLLGGISNTQIGQLNPIPRSGSPALDAANVKSVPANGFYIDTDHLGAFPKDLNWAADWSALGSFNVFNGTDARAVTIPAPAQPATGPTVDNAAIAAAIPALVIDASNSLNIMLPAGAVTGATGYQWRLNGADIAGANSASLSIQNAQAGNYSLVVSNANGSTTSGDIPVVKVSIVFVGGVKIEGPATGLRIESRAAINAADPFTTVAAPQEFTIGGVKYLLDISTDGASATSRFFRAVLVDP